MKALIGRNALVGGLFSILGGSILFWAAGGESTWKWLHARDWRPATATVIRSEARSAEEGSGLFIQIAYEFEVEGAACLGTTYDFGRFSMKCDAVLAMIAGPLAPGRRIEVFYNPRQPEHSVVDRSFDNRWFAGLVGLVWAAIGVTIMIADYRTLRFLNPPPTTRP